MKILNDFERMTKDYEKLSGEKIPAGYYSACEMFIHQVHFKTLVEIREKMDKTIKDCTVDGMYSPSDLLEGFFDLRKEIRKEIKNLKKL